jgi:CBS domain containing-hemolysin-like protein
LEQLQHIPVVGETITIAGFEFEITQMEGRRILQVLVSGSATRDLLDGEH